MGNRYIIPIYKGMKEGHFPYLDSGIIIYDDQLSKSEYYYSKPSFI